MSKSRSGFVILLCRQCYANTYMLLFRFIFSFNGFSALGNKILVLCSVRVLWLVSACACPLSLYAVNARSDYGFSLLTRHKKIHADERPQTEYRNYSLTYSIISPG